MHTAPPSPPPPHEQRAHRLRPLRAVLLRRRVIVAHRRVPPDGPTEAAVAAGARHAADLHIRRDALLRAAHRQRHPGHARAALTSGHARQSACSLHSHYTYSMRERARARCALLATLHSKLTVRPARQRLAAGRAGSIVVGVTGARVSLDTGISHQRSWLRLRRKSMRRR